MEENCSTHDSQEGESREMTLEKGLEIWYGPQIHVP